MPNSEGQSSKAKKSKSDNFVWSRHEVELLLNVVLEYKTARGAVDSERKSGHGRVVLLYFDKCEEI